MTTTFKEDTNGFYCAECRMSFDEPQAACPYCGSLVSNYEELLTNFIIEQLTEELQYESNVSRTN